MFLKCLVHILQFGPLLILHTVVLVVEIILSLPMSGTFSQCDRVIELCCVFVY